MKSKITIISILAIILVVSIVILYISIKDSDSSNTVTNNNTNETITSSREEIDIKQSVWSQLPQEQRDNIGDMWRNGKLNRITLDKDALMSNGDDIVEIGKYAGKEIYVVDFPVDVKSVPNNIIVYADMDDYDIIGYGLVD